MSWRNDNEKFLWNSSAKCLVSLGLYATARVPILICFDVCVCRCLQFRMAVIMSTHFDGEPSKYGTRSIKAVNFHSDDGALDSLKYAILQSRLRFKDKCSDVMRTRQRTMGRDGPEDGVDALYTLDMQWGPGGKGVSMPNRMKSQKPQTVVDVQAHHLEVVELGGVGGVGF
jgi:hypothetical protein